MSRVERILDRDIKVLLHRNPSLQAFSDELDKSSWAGFKKTLKRKNGTDPYSSKWYGISRGKSST